MTEREVLILKDIVALLMDIKESLEAIRQAVRPDTSELVAMHEGKRETAEVE